jgi:diguanylate cyclase (GGDEF)-like protein
MTGILVGLLAPTALMLYAGITGRALAPVPLALAMAAGGVLLFASLGRVLGKRDERLRQLSPNDELTGLANRRTFEARLDQEVARAQRYGTPCAVAMVDLDRFADLNARFGRAAGDEVLRGLGSLLAAETRAGDLLARYGDDRFVAVLANADRAAGAAWSARIRERLAAASVLWEGDELPLAASFGVSSTASWATSRLALTADAARALYEAKLRGGDTLVVLGTAAPDRPALRPALTPVSPTGPAAVPARLAPCATLM